MKIMVQNKNPSLEPETMAMNAHQFLVEFLKRYDELERGTVHDFFEVTIAHMIQEAIMGIDEYLKIGHKNVSEVELMNIILDSFIKQVDKKKRNLDQYLEKY